MSYAMLRPLLFSLDAETAHEWTLAGLDRSAWAARLIGAPRIPRCPCNVMGIDFPNPVGLAAGLDKNADHIDALATLGFGFIEVGTVTPRPQPGNPRPRLFRLPEARALINRMGFNNLGVEHLAACVERARYRGVLGINIGKNFDTPIERAHEDYLHCMSRVYPLASYIAVNISSPNTANLRALQRPQELNALLGALKQEQRRLAEQHGRYVPLAVKIAPDLDAAQLTAIARLLLQHKLDAVIAANTTVMRDTVQGCAHAGEAGGLSGAPLTRLTLGVVRKLVIALDGGLPVIAVGGIMQPADAIALLDAGARLVQLYSGLVYRGPALVRETVTALCRRSARLQ